MLECDYAVGCDGFWGVSRQAFPAEVSRVFERTYPYAWLGVLADVAPSHDELVYARHERGFALLSMRSPSVSRLYLQVPAGTEAGRWSDEEIWDELERRFETDDGWRLERGPVTQKSVTPMRSFVHEPMRHGRLFLAGDAAHIVPPTGAKGLNLAVGDVVTLARALVHEKETGSADLLDAYSATCLRRIWQAERFSSDMTAPAAPGPGRHRLRRPPPAGPAGTDRLLPRGRDRAGRGVHRVSARLAVRPWPGIRRPRSVLGSTAGERSSSSIMVDPLPIHYS